MKPRHNLQVILLLAFVLSLSACPTERFRHEKYQCNSSATGIAELILNDTNVGDKVKVIDYLGEKTAKIISSSKDLIILNLKESEIKIERKTGTVKVKKGNRYIILSCSKSVFTM